MTSFPNVPLSRHRRGVRLSIAEWLQATTVAIVLSLAVSGESQGRGDSNWYTAWAVSHGQRFETPALSGNSVRMIIRPTISGTRVRLRLENTLGREPVTFSATYLGKQSSGAGVVPGTNQQLMFEGKPRVSLAPGAWADSDPIKFTIDAFQTYTVSIDVTSAADISSHFLGLASNYMATGAHAADPSADPYVQVPDNNTGPAGATWPLYWIAALDVESASTTGTIVLFGDSITDGRCSTRTEHGASAGVVQKDLYRRFGDILAERLAALPANESKAIANEGIAGNKVLSGGGTGPNGLARMDRDVLARPNVTHIVFFEGTNDIAGGADAASVIDGTQQVINRAHAAGVKIIGVTMIPRGGANGFTSIMEHQRVVVNDWIRRKANFDGVIDFAELLKGAGVSSNGAEKIQPAYSCFDGIHPNDSGYDAMGKYIDLGLFRNQ